MICLFAMGFFALATLWFWNGERVARHDLAELRRAVGRS